MKWVCHIWPFDLQQINESQTFRPMEFYCDLSNLCLSNVGEAKCGSPKVMEVKLKANIKTHSVRQQKQKHTKAKKKKSS